MTKTSTRLILFIQDGTLHYYQRTNGQASGLFKRTLKIDHSISSRPLSIAHAATINSNDPEVTYKGLPSMCP